MSRAITRETVIAELRSLLGASSDNDLMDRLQEHPYVSGECVHLSDVPSSDLVAALVRVREGR